MYVSKAMTKGANKDIGVALQRCGKNVSSKPSSRIYKLKNKEQDKHKGLQTGRTSLNTQDGN